MPFLVHLVSWATFSDSRLHHHEDPPGDHCSQGLLKVVSVWNTFFSYICQTKVISDLETFI